MKKLSSSAAEVDDRHLLVMGIFGVYVDESYVKLFVLSPSLEWCRPDRASLRTSELHSPSEDNLIAPNLTKEVQNKSVAERKYNSIVNFHVETQVERS